MSLIRFALERYQFTALMLILATLLGVMSFLNMPRSEDPQFNFAAATVITVYPGASPLDVEQLVVDPLEESINELEDIKKIESTVRDGVAVTFVEFMQGTDADDALDDVTKAASNAERLMPQEVAEIRVQKQSPTDVNIFQLALTTESAEYGELQRLAERLERDLERVPGVMRSESWGFPEQQIQINLDFERMKQAGVSFGQVFSAVSGDGQNIPGGDLDFGANRYNVKTSGDFESVDQIIRTPILGTGSESLTVRDVADVSFGYADDSHRTRFNGSKSVYVTAVQRTGTNIFSVARDVREAAAAFSNRLPNEIELQTVFDQSTSVNTRIGGFFKNLIQGVLLVGLVVILVLGFRASAIVMISIPISLLIALGWLDYAGYGLQQMSIVGLVIALGLLVDNAIVVTENIARYRKSGHGAIDAAIKGTSQVAWPIVSSTVTTVLAFLPMVVLKSGTGDFIRSMPLTVVFALFASLIVSLMLTPLLTSRL
ncbi:MAG: efflux RND transporter permease subunit, partial [Rhodothermales bacterium]|nr:efflux RND transporter permease subunit [Rhodothermales bacterium]